MDRSANKARHLFMLSNDARSVNLREFRQYVAVKKTRLNHSPP
jgi:hypothetical protein